MATRYYIGSGGDWDTDANWATSSGGTGPASYPTAADDAIFDDNSGDCTLDANAACLSLTIGTSGKLYAGTLDAATFDMDIGTGGLDCTYGGSAILDLGTGTWSCSGDWDSLSIGTLTVGTSTIELTGTTKIFRGKGTTSDGAYNLTISNGASYTQTGSMRSSATSGSPAIDIAGDVTQNLGIRLIASGNTSFKFRSTGSIDGTGEVWVDTNTISDGGVEIFEAGFTMQPSLFIVYSPRDGCPIVAGDYNCPFRIESESHGGTRATIFGTGTFTINSLELQADGITNLELDLATNNPTVTIQGDWTIDLNSTGNILLDASSNAIVLQGDLIDETTGAGTFSSDSQALTLTGNNAQDIDLCDVAWGLITINKAGDVGTVTFSGDIDCTGIDVDASGDIDFGDGFTHAYGASGMVFSHAGNVDLGTGTQHTITNGDFDASGITGNVTTYITSTVIFDGTCAFDLPWPRGRLYDVEVTAGSSLVAGTVTSCGWEGLVLGAGATLTCNGGSTVYYVYHNTRDLTLGDNSRITGTSNYELAATGPTLTRGSNVIIDPAIFYYRYSHTPMPGEYDCDVEFRSYQDNRTITMPSGTMTVTGNLTITILGPTTPYTIDFNTNNGTLVVYSDLVLNIDSAAASIVFDGGSNAIEVQGDVVDQTQGYTFTADGQPLTLTGTNNIDIDLCDGTWGLITINKAGDVGTVTFSGSGGAAGINAIASGDIDFGDNNTFSWGASGLVFDHANDIDWGTVNTTHTNAGDWDYFDIGGNILYGATNATMNLTGASNNWHAKNGSYACNVNIAVGALYAIPSRIYFTAGMVLDIAGTLQIGPPETGLFYVISIWVWSQAQLKIRSTGVITTSGVDPTRNQIALYQNYSGGGLTLFESGGTITMDGGIGINVRYTDGVFVAGDYSNVARVDLSLGNPSMPFTFNSGNFTFPELRLQNIQTIGNDLTINMLTNNPAITVQDDFVIDIDDAGNIILDAGSNALTVQGNIVNEITGAGTLTADSQSLSLTGNNDQDIDACGASWGLITINKAGDVGEVLFSANMIATGLLSQACGRLDFGSGLTHMWDTFGLSINDNGTTDLGDGVQHNVGGNWDVYHSGGSWDGTHTASLTIVADATCQMWWGAAWNPQVYDWTIEPGANVTMTPSYGTFNVANDVDVQGSLNINNCPVSIYRNLSIDGDIVGDGSSAGHFLFNTPDPGTGIISFTGTITNAGIVWGWDHLANGVIAEGDYSWLLIRCSGGQDSIAILDGTYSFTEIELQPDGYESRLDLQTNGATVTTGNLRFDVSSGGIARILPSTNPIIMTGDMIDEVTTGIVNLGYSDITLTGTNDQDWDQPTTALVGTLTINKTAGTVTPQSVMTCNEFIGQDGTFDPNAQTINVLAVGGGSGNCDWQANFEFVSHEDAFNSCSWTIGGNFTADGQSLKATGGFVDDVPAAIGSGTSRSFTMPGQYVSVLRSSELEPTNYVSVGAWLNISEWDLYGNIVGWPNPGAIGYSLHHRSDDCPINIQFGLWNGVSVGFSPSAIFACNEWHHVMGVYDGSYIRMYLDGIEVTPATAFSGTLDYTVGYSGLQFGGDSERLRYSTSKIDDVRIYSDALTADEVTYVVTNGVSGDDPGDVNLVGYWKFDGNLLDETDNNNDGTSVGLDAPDWTLTVAGTAVASGVGEVAYSDASGGTIIDASAGPWVNNGDNDWWYFGEIQLAGVQSFGPFSQYAVFLADFPTDTYIASALLNIVHMNDVGVLFRQTMYESDAILDLSSATELEMRFKKPDGTVLTKTATLSDDGTDGRLQYASIAGDLDQLGEWKVQPRVAFGSNQWYGTVDKFRVYENL